MEPLLAHASSRYRPLQPWSLGPEHSRTVPCHKDSATMSRGDSEELSASFFPHLYHYWPKMPMWTETSVVGALKALAMQARVLEASPYLPPSLLPHESLKQIDISVTQCPLFNIFWINSCSAKGIKRSSKMFQEPDVLCFSLRRRSKLAKVKRSRSVRGFVLGCAEQWLIICLSFVFLIPTSCRVVVRSWQNMETAKRRGLCRHIGVSNYPVEFMKARSCHHIKVPLFGRCWTMLDSFWAQEIDEYKTEPIYNEQQELHPLAQFRDVQDYARKAKVSLTGYGTGRLRREFQYSL